MNTKLMVTSLRNVSLAAAYVFGISQFLFSAGKLFDGVDNTFLAPFVMLLLLVLSVSVVGSLLFGQAVWLFLDNKKTDSMKSAIYSIVWLFLITVVVVTSLLVIK